jgi:ferrous-iron efflux pump FieF
MERDAPLSMTAIPAAERARLTRNAAIASLSVAFILLLLKGYAAWATGSVAMLGSLADTGLDILASLVTLFGVHIAAQPADEGHRFGHGKAEAIAAMFQVVVISVSALAIAVRAASRLMAGDKAANAEYGIGVSIIAILLTLALVAYQHRVIAQTRSVAIRADNVHYQSDLLLNGAVIAALVIDQFLGVAGADPVFGVIIALWLLYGAWRASSEALDQLMDKEWPEEKRARFLAIAAKHPELVDIHDLRTRTSGAQDFVQFHVRVDPDLTVAEAHRIMDEVEAKIAAEFPDTEILIHPDPVGQVDRAGEDDEKLRETPL